MSQDEKALAQPSVGLATIITSKSTPMGNLNPDQIEVKLKLVDETLVRFQLKQQFQQLRRDIMLWQIMQYQGKRSLSLLFLTGFLVSMIAQLLIVAPAKADCIYEGKTYKTGAIRGPYICMPDGTWQPR